MVSGRHTIISGEWQGFRCIDSRAATVPDKNIKVGLRFTMTRDNASELPQLLALMDRENVDKFYFSHLNYADAATRTAKGRCLPPDHALGDGSTVRSRTGRCESETRHRVRNRKQ